MASVSSVAEDLGSLALAGALRLETALPAALAARALAAGFSVAEGLGLLALAALLLGRDLPFLLAGLGLGLLLLLRIDAGDGAAGSAASEGELSGKECRDIRLNNDRFGEIFVVLDFLLLRTLRFIFLTFRGVAVSAASGAPTASGSTASVGAAVFAAALSLAARFFFAGAVFAAAFFPAARSFFFCLRSCCAMRVRT